LYVDFTGVDAAIAAVVYGLDVTDQAIVDGYAGAIDAAVAALVLKPTKLVVNATTSVNNYISITKVSNNGWILEFSVVETYSDGTTAVVTYSINLSGNNANADGRYTFSEGPLKGYTLVYDLKGNGKNIKEFKLIK
ncbi:MAG: hypothetical protein FWH55_02195, partial [Oscillospiraceae bacterium]|nr:hypothetical protein [Oscillospiraceae bacterium]